MGNIVTFITILIIIVALAGFIYWYYRRQKRQRDRLAAELGGDKLEWDKVYSGRLQGKEYSYVYSPGSRYQKSYFRIYIDIESAGEFRVHREGKIDRMSKHLGISAEIQTGDREFDEKCYIETDSVAFTRACFDAADARGSVLNMFNLGITAVACTRDRLAAEISPFTFTERIGRDLVESAVTELIMLREAIPADSFAPANAGTPAWKMKRNAVYTVSITSLVLGGLLLILGMKFYQPLDDVDMFVFSLHYSIPVLVLFCPFAVVWLKGRSTSLRELAVNLLFALFGIPMTGVGLAIVLNGLLDTSAITIHEATVTGKRSSHSHSSTSYYISVETWWRALDEIEEIKVSHQIYRQVRAGKTTVRIASRPGYLHYEWVKSIAVKEPGQG